MKAIKSLLYPIIKKLLPLKYLEEPGRVYGFDREKMKSLENKFKGERCFIIGNGPSLNELDLNKIKDEYAFGVNAFFFK